MTPRSAFKALGLPANSDVPSIRKAYAARLKSFDVDADPDGYAQLRLARDIALHAAKIEAATATSRENELALPDEAPTSSVDTSFHWPYRAPNLFHHVGHDPATGVAIVPSATDAEAKPNSTATLSSATVLDIPGIATDGVFSEPPLREQEKLPPGMVSALASLDQELAQLLLVDDELLNVALTDNENARAMRYLNAIVADVRQADILTHENTENWLADLLAQSWPRSASLLESVAHAFGWENERGHINERPAISWLNSRLRGLRFQQNVLDPSHTFHTTWNELCRPGHASWLDRRRTKRTKVEQLLTGIRRHFPEIESSLNPQRVQSWEDRGSDWGSGGGINWGGILLCAFAATQILTFLARTTSSPEFHQDSQTSDAPVAAADSDPEYISIRGEAISAAFGEGATISWLVAKQPNLAATLERKIKQIRMDGGDKATAIKGAVDHVRRLVFIVGRNESGKTLTDVASLHLARAVNAETHGPDACLSYFQTLDLRFVPLSAVLLNREQILAKRMVEAGQLVEPKVQTAQTTNIPEELVLRVMEETGLQRKVVADAFHDKGQPATLCAVKRSLLKQTLSWPGPEKAAILRLL